MKKNYKTAIIGLGNIGYGLSQFDAGFTTTHFEAYYSSKKINLTAVCDIDTKLEDLFSKKIGEKKTRFYKDFREMMRNEKPQIVSICTPDETHYTILKEVAEFPSVEAIWCEKPLAVTLKQGKEMVQICRARNIKLLVNYTRRYDAFYRKIKDKAQYVLGEMKAITCYYSGGITTNGSHMLDLLHFFLGDCFHALGREIAGEIWGMLEFKNCKTVNVVPIAAKNYSIFELNILGEKGRLNIYNKPFNEYEYQYFIPQKSHRINAQFISVNEKTPLPRRAARDYMDNALADLLECVIHNREPFSSGRTALKSLEILSALVYSAKHEGKLTSLPFTKLRIRIPNAKGDIKKWQKKD